LEPIVEASGEPPKPFVGFFLGHVPEPNARTFSSTGMANGQKNITIHFYKKNKGKRIMHKYYKLHHRKLTWIPKIAIFELRYILKAIILGIYVRFPGGGQPLCNEKRPQAAFISPCQTQLLPGLKVVASLVRAGL